MKNFDKIKVLATAKKIKLSDVATSAGISYQQLNRIIRTQSTTIETMGKIAEALGVPASYFVEECPSDFITIGDDSPGAGKDNVVNADLSGVLMKAFDEIASQRRLTEDALARLAKAQAQVDDLITILKSKLL